MRLLSQNRVVRTITIVKNTNKEQSSRYWVPVVDTAVSDILWQCVVYDERNLECLIEVPTFDDHSSRWTRWLGYQ